MLNSGHPDDERLSALAAREPDAVDDTALAAHVDGCSRCADLVSDLATLRAALAEMPDLAPQRPLRLLPPVDAEAAGGGDSVGRWMRRLFAPVLTAGAALAMVGMVGTALPAMQQAATGGTPQDAALEAQVASEAPAGGAGAETAPYATGDVADDAAGDGGTTLQAPSSGERSSAAGDALLEDGAPLPAERSPWPMVLFTGVALMIGAALLRWILAPRPGA